MITCPLCERLWKLSRKLLSLVIGHRTQVFDSHDAGPLSQTGHVFTQSLILRPIRPVSRPFFGHTRAYIHTHTYTQLRTAKLFLLATTYTLLSLPFAFQQVRNAWAREEDGLLSRTAGGRTGWWKVLATNPLLRGRGKFGLIRGIVASGRTIPCLVMQLHAQLLPSPFEDVSSVAVARGHLPLNTRGFFFFFSSSSFIEANFPSKQIPHLVLCPLEKLINDANIEVSSCEQVQGEGEYFGFFCSWRGCC